MESWEKILELIEALSPLVGSVAAVSFSWAFMWKLFSRFTELSNRVSSLEGKFEMLEKLVPLEEFVKELRKLRKKSPKKSNNPGPRRSRIADIVQIISVGIGILNLLFFGLSSLFQVL